MQIHKDNLPLFLAKILPYAAISVLILGFILFTITSGLNKATNGLIIIGIPVILAAGIAIWRFRKVDSSAITKPFVLSLMPRYFKYLTLIFIVLYILSLIILAQEGVRPPIYFILVVLMAGIVLIEILGIESGNNHRRGIILTQIAFLAMNIIFGQTLVLPLYFGGGDLLYHMGFIASITESGQAIPDVTFIGDYQYFALFHVFNASGVLVTGMEIQTTYFILNGLVFITSILIVYLLAKQVTTNTRLALLAAFLYSMTREMLFNGMYMNTREMAFLFCLLILYLLVRRTWHFRILALVLILPLELISLESCFYL
jgi:hypothetical protein